MISNKRIFENFFGSEHIFHPGSHVKSPNWQSVWKSNLIENQAPFQRLLPSLDSTSTQLFQRRRLKLDLQLPVQSVSITTKVVSSNPVHGEVYSNTTRKQIIFFPILRGGARRVRPPLDPPQSTHINTCISTDNDDLQQRTAYTLLCHFYRQRWPSTTCSLYTTMSEVYITLDSGL